MSQNIGNHDTDCEFHSFIKSLQLTNLKPVKWVTQKLAHFRQHSDLISTSSPILVHTTSAEYISVHKYLLMCTKTHKQKKKLTN